ncbi:MAG: UDP-N-acetyl-D-glucosamine dehydrogenase [Elusimicrobia bacterium RIFOXYD2_FULL_34_15]|nr:MAG: UDP-N-acetyl-D-glucosamine dehydrogenase [Elusimicrobia bacterium RIFOXYD2_FULL_34_15]
MNLKEKIGSGKAVVAIIGLGYVGLPLAIEFAKKGFKTFGLDIDNRKVSLLKEKKSYIKHIPSENIKNLKNFEPSADFSKLRYCDCAIVCVPTPLTEMKEPDMSYVVNTTEMISKYLKKGQLIVLESTTYPGTTDEVVKPILEKTGLKAGKDFYLAFSPEREDPGNKNFTTKTIPKVVGGINKISTDIASLLYGSVINKIVSVSSMKVAEATKMLENTFRAINIALVNELKILFDKMGFDVWEVIEASKTKPFGYMPFYPGPGWGGHCIPIDPFYLSWKAKQYNFQTKFIELAGEVNTRMPEYVIEKLQDALNKKGLALSRSKILLLGMSYKKDSDDIRESPSLELIEILEKKGAQVSYNDPYIPIIPKMRHHKIEKKSVALTSKNLKGFDAVLISTNHTNYDYDFILKNSKLIVDTRNAINKKDSKIVRA